MASPNRILYPVHTVEQTHLHLAIMRGLRDPRAYFGLMTTFCGQTTYHA